MSKFYITTPIYYLNAEPHIGHASTTIAADVVARVHRLAGDDVFFLTGTDEHGSKNEKIAKEQGLDPQDYVDQVSAKFSLLWDRLEIAPDDFIRTTEDRHKKTVTQLVSKIKESGKIYKGEYKGLYCVGHEAFIKEADLADGLCPEHKTKPEQLTEENWFFKLSDYREILKEKIETGELEIQPEERKNEVLGLLKTGLEDIAISRPNVSWGIPLPFEPTHTIYVWVDALINYVTGAGFGEDQEKYDKYWPADVHLIGKDILKFHAVIWPAMLLAAGLPIPKKIFAHGYFTVDGQKMSKTIGNVIDPNLWIDKYGPDVVRYFLLREIPFGQDGDVSEEKLRARYKSDLANSLGNLFSRLTNMIEKYSDGVLPDITKSRHDEELLEASKLTANFKFNQALDVIWGVLAHANQTIDKEKPWELAKASGAAGSALGKSDAKLAGLLADLSSTLLAVARTLAPYMPEASEKIRSAMSAEKIIKAEPLFPNLS